MAKVTKAGIIDAGKFTNLKFGIFIAQNYKYEKNYSILFCGYFSFGL